MRLVNFMCKVKEKERTKVILRLLVFTTRQQQNPKDKIYETMVFKTMKSENKRQLCQETKKI